MPAREAVSALSVSPITAWSYSRFAMWETCPLQFKLTHIDKHPKPTSAAMQRGDKIHKGIAAYLTGAAEAPPAEATKHPFPAKLIEELKGFDDKVIEQQWGYTRSWQPTGWFGKDTWFRNIADVAVLYDDLTADVPDWKTGKKYGSNADQMELTAVAMFKRFKPVKHVTARMVYLDSGEEDVAEFAKAEEPALTAKWENKVAPMFSDTVFAPRPNDKCRFCDFSRSNQGLCKFG